MTETILLIAACTTGLLTALAYYNLRWRRYLRNAAEINPNF